MAYRNLYKPLSQFVDPMSTETSAMLKERYLHNFQAQDAISQSMSDLTVASFENDQRMYNDLYNTTRSELDGLSERGDYENMFMPVSRLAKSYRETASPLVENYTRYQTDKEAKEKMLEEGKITMSDYQGWLKKSRLTEQDGDYAAYKGIELDENGRVNKSSMYGGTSIAQYVDVQQEILDALNDIPEVKQGGYTVKGYEQGPDGLVYAVEKEGQTVEYIPQEAVMAVTNNILNRPDVSAYMQQTADFATLDMDEGTIDNILAKHAYDLREREETAGADAVDRIRSTEALGNKRRAARAIAYNKDASNYLGTALATRQPSAYGGSYKMTYADALNKKLEENRLDAGAFRVTTPGGEFQIKAANIIGDDEKVTAASINANIERVGEAANLAYETVLDQLPALAELLESNGQSLEDRLQDIPTLMDDIMRANPEADRATIARTLNAADSQIQLYRQEAELSQRLLRNSYGGFAETFVSDVVSDFAIDMMIPADSLSGYFKEQPIENNFVYDENSNTITVTKDAPQQGAREIANIVMLKDILPSISSPSALLTNAGVDANESALEITQQLFGVDREEAKEMIALASSVEVDKSAVTTGGGTVQQINSPGLKTAPTSYEDSGVTEMSNAINKIIERSVSEAHDESVEFLSEKSKVNYAMDVTSVALGDDKKGTRSKLIVNELKGKDLSAYANSEIIVPAGTEGNINTVEDLVGKENIGLAQIADVRFTQVPTASGMQAGVVLQLKKATGADRDATLGASSVTMLYDDVISSFDPTMQSRVTNEFDNPGMQMANDALSLMMNIPGAVSPEDGVTFNRNINGTDLEITMFPTIREMGDDNLGIIAGIGKVYVKGSGVDGEPLEENYPLATFIERYNELKAQNNR
jgi:hypothetical protein